MASHIWRTGDAWRTPGSSLKDAWIKSDGGPLLYERYWRTRRPRPTGRWACGPVRVCRGMSGSVRRVGFETFEGVWSFFLTGEECGLLRFVPNSEGLFNGFFVSGTASFRGLRNSSLNSWNIDSVFERVLQLIDGPFYGLTGRSLLLGGAVSSRENLANLAKSGKSGKSGKSVKILQIWQIWQFCENLANL